MDHAYSLFNEIPWELSPNDGDSSWSRWKSHFFSVVKETIPSKLISTKPNPPWISNDIVQFIRKRSRLYKRAKRSINPNLMEKYKLLRNRIVSTIRARKRDFFASFCSILVDPKRFWSTVKRMHPKQQPVSSELKHKNESATTPIGKASLLNSYFSECFNHVEVSSKYIIPELAELPAEFLCSEEFVFTSIAHLRANIACGPDLMTARMLKLFANFISPSLTQVFNQSLSTGIVPTEWKCSNIAPIPKSSNGTLVSNYHPISLLSIPGKILERHVYNILLEELDSRHFFSNCQYGFRPGRGTGNALVASTCVWH